MHDHVQVDDRVWSAQRPERVAGQEREAHAEWEVRRRTAPAGAGALGRPEQRADETHGQQHKTHGVEDRAWVGLRADRARDPPQQQQPGDPDGQVDEEDPAPAAGADEQTAERRAQCRGEEQGQGGRDGHLATAEPVLAEQDAQCERHQRRTHQALQPTGCDEQGDVRRDGAARGGQHEGHHADRVDPQGAEPFGQVGGRGQGNTQGEQVAADHPLHGVERRCQLTRDVRDGDVDDARVDHAEQRPHEQAVPRGGAQCGSWLGARFTRHLSSSVRCGCRPRAHAVPSRPPTRPHDRAGRGDVGSPRCARHPVTGPSSG